MDGGAVTSPVRKRVAYFGTGLCSRDSACRALAMMEPASPQSVRSISKTPSGSVLSNSSRPQAAGKFGIDLKTRTVALNPATFKETVQQLTRLLGKNEDEDGTDFLDVRLASQR